MFSRHSHELMGAPWICQNTVVKKVDECTTSKRGSSPSSTSADFMVVGPKPGIEPPAAETIGARKSVKWQDSSPTQNLAAISASNATINDLCNSMATKQACNSCLGSLGGQGWQYVMFLMDNQESDRDPLKTTSLTSLLSSRAQVRLTRRQRYSIALTLASSHLQLYASPWLEARWSKADILLQCTDGRAILTDQIYISRDFVSSVSGTLSSFESANGGLSSLGIILLELCFGVAIEEHEIRKKFSALAYDSTISHTLDLIAALEWCDQHAVEEAGQDFASAIEWCLKNTTARNSREDQSWREELFIKVVEPLEECCRYLNSSIGGAP